MPLRGTKFGPKVSENGKEEEEELKPVLFRGTKFGPKVGASRSWSE